MPSTYSPLLRIELQASGENDTTWGTKTNNNFSNVIEAAIAGMSTIAMTDSNYTLSVNSGAADEARSAILLVQGTLTAQRDVVVPALTKTYIVKNECNFAVSITTASGTGVAVQAGTTGIVFCDGTNVNNASSPTSDGSITPSKLDTTVSASWRLGGALGVGRAQTYVPNYGVIGIDGATGSRTTWYVSGSSKGEINATSTTFDVAAAPGSSLTLSTNSTSRLSIDNNGAVAVGGSMTLGGTLSGTVGSMSGNFTVGGVMAASGGFSGITGSNILSALGYTPIQQGTGASQNSAYAVKIGWNPTTSKLRAQVANTDLGNIMFEATPNVFAPISGGNYLYDFASNTAGLSYTSRIQFREVNHQGAQSFATEASPGFAFHWGNVCASQLRLNSNATFSFVNNPGNAQESLIAATGYFTGDVVAFYSDMRLKTKLEDITNARAIVRRLNGFKYVENDLAREHGYNNTRVQIGLSAQQVKEVLPELVDLAPFDSEPVPLTEGGGWRSKSGEEYMTVNYQRMVPVLVEAIKEQDDMLLRMREELFRYQSALAAVMNRLSALEGGMQ